MSKSFISITAAAKYLGVSTDTLRNWDKSGSLKTIRTKGGARRYALKELAKVKKELLPKKVRQLGLLSVSDAAKSLNVSADTLRQWERKGLIEALRTEGGTRRFTRSAIKSLQKEIGVNSEIKKHPRVKREEIESSHQVVSAHHTHRFQKRAILIPFTIWTFALIVFMIVVPTLQDSKVQNQLTIQVEQLNEKVENLVSETENFKNEIEATKELVVTKVQTEPTVIYQSNGVSDRLISKDAFIGETILDSYGNIYLKNPKTGTNESTVGTWEHPYFGMYLHDFQVTKGDATIKGRTVMGDHGDDEISLVGRVNTDIIPTVGSNLSLGSGDAFFNHAYISNVHGTSGSFGAIHLVVAPTTLSGATSALCWDGSGASNIVDCDGSATDLAEYFGSADPTVEAGDLVVIDKIRPATSDGKAYVVKTNQAYDQTIVGIVSTKPNQIYGEGLFNEEDNAKAVALAGRVPVKVSVENGPIEIGDYLTSSSTPGLAMKATQSGPTVGKALESFSCEVQNCSGKIMVFVNISYVNPDNYLANLVLDNEGNILIPEANSDTNKVAEESSTAKPENSSEEPLSKLDSEDLVVSGVFKALGESMLSSTMIAGDLSVDGTFSISGNSLNALTILHIQSNPLAELVEFFNNQVTIDKKGNLMAQTITTNQLKVKANKVSGQAKIEAGEISIQIQNDLVSQGSRIMITPTQQTDLVLAVTEKIDGQEFIVSSSAQASDDLTFDWWMVNEEE